MESNTVTEAEILAELRGKIGYDYKQYDMARDVGVSKPFVGQVLAGKAGITCKFLDYLGIEAVYVRKPK